MNEDETDFEEMGLLPSSGFQPGASFRNVEQLEHEYQATQQQLDILREQVIKPTNNGPAAASISGARLFAMPADQPALSVGWTNSGTIIGLDFETWGSRPLPKVGLDNYLADPDFKVNIAHIAWKIGAGGNIDARSRGYDFVHHGYYGRTMQDFRMEISGASVIVAHNVTFERRVLDKMGINSAHITWIDSAMIARAMGAAGALENAAPQLLDTKKMASGKRLIQKFSVPNEQYRNRPPIWDDVRDDPDWDEYNTYCGVDAQLALRIALRYGAMLLGKEYDYEKLTHSMNEIGWTVDRGAVERMQAKYQLNKELTLDRFRIKYDLDGELNLNSLKQLKEWCLARGVRAKSFDEEHVNDMLTQVESKLATAPSLQANKRRALIEVRDLLRTKQILGGSSLKKLPVIELTTGEDGQLRDQYMHVGAGQSYRTTGRGVQMQNLKRLHNPRDMSALFGTGAWTNTELAENMRQLFTAHHPGGSLIVGDFSSVESRGLAYLAGEDWKLKAYRDGKDLYKEQAAGIYRVGYYDVTKDQRQTGKVGELSCGYGAGAGAVKSFATKMGIPFTEVQAGQLVRDWRAINPKIVDLWKRLGEAFLAVVQSSSTLPGSSGQTVQLANGLRVEFSVTDTPASLSRQHPGAKSIVMTLIAAGRPYLQRYFHGCYMRGKDVCYYKPTDRVGGALWSNNYRDPKTGQIVFYKLYGGKLAGILTQSFCREIFFHVMHNIYRWTTRTPGVTLMGQFHDEIVTDYDPTVDGSMSLGDVMRVIETLMAETTGLPFTGFPLAAEVQSDYRYIK